MAPPKLPPETKYQSLQEDEVQALQAIYYDGFEEVDCEIGPWKTTTERAFNLLLRSRVDPDTMVKLLVKMTATYPNTVPLLNVEQTDSLQPKFQAELQDILTKKPKGLLGSEMIHEIAQAIEDVLDNAVQHTEQTEQAPTLEEERTQKESLAKEAALEKARKQEAERLAAKEAEKRLVSEKMVEELEHRQHRKRKSAHFQDSHPAIFKEASDNHLLNPQPRMSRENTREDQEIVSFPPIDFDLPWVIFQGQAGRKQYVFKSVINPHDDNSAWVSLLSGEGPITDVWTTFPFGIKHEDAKIVLKEASLRSFDNTKTTENEDFRERISSLGSILKDVADLTNKNSSFLPILKTGIFYDKNFEHSRIIRIIYPFVPHGSLHDQFLVEGFTIDEVRERIKELLAALELLHSRGILHRRLHLRNMFIVQGRKGGRNLRLADCGFQNEFDKAMHPDDCEARQKRQDEAKATDLVIGTDPSSGTAPSRKTIQKLILKARASYDGEFEVNGTPVDELLRCPPPGWTAPEITESPEAGGNSKTDIWDLGIVILQMLFGPEIMGFDSPDAALKKFVPSSTLSSFLKKMLHNEPSKRVTPFHLSNDPFLSEPNDRRYGTAPGGEFDFSPLVFPAVARPPKEDQSASNSVSRYNTDFDEIIRVGKGGFGSVFQARNKVDGQFYAIKKVRRSPATLYKALSEIVLLSRLNHPNVVRYFGAWIETAEDKSNDNEETDSEYDSQTDSDPDSFPPTTGALLSRPSVISHLTGDMDHVSSKGGYIEFGYDEEEPPEFNAKVNNNGFTPDSDDDQDRESSSKDPLSRRKSSDSAGPRPLKQVLYIQMEFCEKKTLRDLIMADLSDKHNQIWSLLRSIVEGLCHIHGNGIIHRDLKPENIFIEGSGIPRIGDFGLATSGLFTVRKANAQPSMHSPDLTRSVGTAKYVAPELRSAVSESYTDKVDMYSLGIILFEMCAHFETEYGRTLQITSLRQKDHVLPPLFDRGEPAKFGEVIMQLVDHDPGKRPTSEDLLKSGEVPLKIEDEMIKRMFHTFKDPDNSEFPKIMEALFSQPIAPVKDYVWDVESQPVPANELILLDLVRQELSMILRLHGAIETSRPLLIPRSKYYSNTAAQLLHPDGTLVQLPYDLTLPNARAIAKNSPSAWKTYTFGSVYRDHHNGGAAEPSLELDFDIMAPTSKDATIEEAEVIKVIDEILDKFPSLNDAPLCFHINHAGLLELIMDFAAVPASQRTLVKEFICRINFTNLTWSKARKLLGAPTVGLSAATLDQLGRFNFCDEPKKGIRKLKAIFESQNLPESFMDESNSIFEHLESLLDFAKRFNVKRRLVLAPFSGVNEKFYSGGLMFQCIFDGRKAEIVAAGGRYDSLIKDLIPNTNTQYPECHAVGFILGWERVWKTMVRLQKDGEKKAFAKKALAETGLWGTRRCDVLVASMDSSLLRSTCIDIVSDLWAADISAELAKDASSPEEIMARSRPDNHIWIVIVRQNAQSFHEMVLKVKDMTKKFDHEVKAPDLVRWLKAELRERRVKERKRLAATEPSKMESSEARGKGTGKK